MDPWTTNGATNSTTNGTTNDTTNTIRANRNTKAINNLRWEFKAIKDDMNHNLDFVLDCKMIMEFTIRPSSTC